MLRLLLILLLLATPSWGADTFFIVIVGDDVQSGSMGFNRAATAGGPEADFMPLVTTATPIIDALAATGFVHNGMRVGNRCSVTRAMLFGYGSPPNPNNLMGQVKRIDDLSTDIEPNPRFRNMIRIARDAGVLTYGIGKVAHINHHWQADPSLSGTYVAALGFTEAPIIITGVAQTYPGHAAAYAAETDWVACGGTHNYWSAWDLAGDLRFYTEYSSKVIWDTVVASIQAKKADGMDETWLYWIALNAPHAPHVVPSDILGCDATSPEKSDLVPGMTLTGPPTELDVYEKAIEYNDTRLEDLLNELNLAVDTITILDDNGLPNLVSLDTYMAECDQSPGKKGTPYRCGTGVSFMVEGPGISAAIMGDQQLNNASDVSTTILGLMGINDPNGFGLDFSDCITASNGQTASACAHSRSDHTDWRFAPIGGTTNGQLARMPDVTNDASGEWDEIIVGVELYAGTEHMILVRTYDTNSGPPYLFSEDLWPIDVGDQNGRYVIAAGTKLATNSAGDGLLQPGDWDSGPSAAEQAQLDLGHKRIADEFTNLGAPNTSYGGASQ